MTDDIERRALTELTEWGSAKIGDLYVRSNTTGSSWAVEAAVGTDHTWFDSPEEAVAWAARQAGEVR
jgi:hypothetical protein